MPGLSPSALDGARRRSNGQCLPHEMDVDKLDALVRQPSPVESLVDTGARETNGQGASIDCPSPRLGARFGWAMVALAVVLIAVATGAGAGGAFLWPKSYTARSQILYVIAQQQPTGFLRDDLALTTQVVLLQSPAVLGPVAQHNGLALDDLSQRVSAAVVSGSEIITVDVRASSPQSASKLGSDVVGQYLAVAGGDQAASPAELYLQGQLAATRAQLNALAAARGPVSPLLQSAADRQKELQGELDQLSLTDLTRPAPKVVVSPYVDPTAVMPRPLITAGAGALGGLLVAFVAAGIVVRRRLRR